MYAKAIDAHQAFLARRGPEVGWNGVALLRELRTQGFTAAYQVASDSSRLMSNAFVRLDFGCFGPGYIHMRSR